MAKGSKLYWIKLTMSFLTSDKVDYLLSQKGGANYVVIYQMLCLKTLNNDGVLGRVIGEVLIPYDAEKIQRDLKHFDIDTIRVALNLYKALGMIYEQEDGLFRIAELNELIGCETDYAGQKRIQRNAKKTLSGQLVDNGVDNVHIDIDIDKEIDKEIDKKHIYGEFKNVRLTDTERKKLEDDYGSKADGLIRYLDEYIEMKGYKAKSHYLAIKKWVVNAYEENIKRQQRLEHNGHSQNDITVDYDSFKNKEVDTSNLEVFLKERNETKSNQ